MYVMYVVPCCLRMQLWLFSFAYQWQLELFHLLLFDGFLSLELAVTIDHIKNNIAKLQKNCK